MNNQKTNKLFGIYSLLIMNNQKTNKLFGIYSLLIMNKQKTNKLFGIYNKIHTKYIFIKIFYIYE
jgi:predicted DNA-binding protein YlxM (UPF0122 family)